MLRPDLENFDHVAVVHMLVCFSLSASFSLSLRERERSRSWRVGSVAISFPPSNPFISLCKFLSVSERERERERSQYLPNKLPLSHARSLLPVAVVWEELLTAYLCKIHKCFGASEIACSTD
jgi:hypothetical protein